MFYGFDDELVLLDPEFDELQDSDIKAEVERYYAMQED